MREVLHLFELRVNSLLTVFGDGIWSFAEIFTPDVIDWRGTMKAFMLGKQKGGAILARKATPLRPLYYFLLRGGVNLLASCRALRLRHQSLTSSGSFRLVRKRFGDNA
ncbi:MAG: hypothetical protein ACR2HX_04225 [Pyrinomonadaceae bacterium]